MRYKDILKPPFRYEECKILPGKIAVLIEDSKTNQSTVKDLSGKKE
jgi:hypothetical protein